jgi:hypothetical protein
MLLAGNGSWPAFSRGMSRVHRCPLERTLGPGAAHVQHQPFVSPDHPPSLSSDDDPAWSDEEDSEYKSGESVTWLRASGFVLGSIAAGAVLALAWHHSGLRERAGDLSWPTLAASPAQGASKPGAEDQLAHILRELDALKKSVSDLSTGQQQIRGTVAALQASQQDLRQRISSAQAGSHWHSDVAALRLRFAIQPKPVTVGSIPRAPAPEQVARRAESGPLPLLGRTQ